MTVALRNNSPIGLPISLLGFGFMRLPLNSGDTGDIDIPAACEMVDAALQAGINYFDTGYLYHREQSEVALRETLVERHDRNSYYIADKMPPYICKSADDQERVLQTQCKRCGVDYFDFYLLHSLNDAHEAMCRAFGSYDFIQEVKRSGRARHIGFSFHGTPELLARMLDEHPIFDFVQLQINYLDWQAQRAGECYRIVREHGLPVVVMEPVKGGALVNLPPAAQALRPDLATPAGRAAFALRYAASLDGVMTVLSGMSTLEQVRENAATFSNLQPFTESDRDIAERISAEVGKANAVPCTACAYCLDVCPVGVDIPQIFSLYNEYKMYGNDFFPRYQYMTMNAEKRADRCVNCGACTERCPQGIDVPHELAAAHPQLPPIEDPMATRFGNAPETKEA